MWLRKKVRLCQNKSYDCIALGMLLQVLRRRVCQRLDLFFFAVDNCILCITVSYLIRLVDNFMLLKIK